ncbi:MAG: PEBP family protein [Parcubacteria group bacterium Gr01-1014_31]|nr:MAG: PEBP family protein [Parcubacteria group bacterium Gr01-1014_31]
MQLVSDDLRDGELMPSTFTCDGQDVAPQLGWRNVPEGTKSFALRCFDPDAPGGGFTHWLVANLPHTCRQLPRGGPLPDAAVEVLNDFGKTGYGGPCPPSGTHRYEFTLYALNVVELRGLTAENFLDQVRRCAVAQATLTAPYRRR